MFETFVVEIAVRRSLGTKSFHSRGIFFLWNPSHWLALVEDLMFTSEHSSIVVSISFIGFPSKGFSRLNSKIISLNSSVMFALCKKILKFGFSKSNVHYSDFLKNLAFLATAKKKISALCFFFIDLRVFWKR